MVVSSHDLEPSPSKLHMDNARHAGEEALRCAELFQSLSKLKRPDQQKDIELLEWSDLTLGPLIGEGSFASVYLVSLAPSKSSGQDERTNKPKHFALKCLKKSITEKDDKKTFTNGASDLAIESKILANMSHEHIVGIHAIKAGCIAQSTCKDEGFFILMDCLVGTLDEQLIQWRKQSIVSRKFHFLPRLRRNKSSPEPNAAVWNRLNLTALGIARGLEYLHSNNVYHGDVKPENIGFDQDGKVRIFDFGLAREIYPEQDTLFRRWAGTPRYAAPEISKNEAFSLSSDVYSFSIVLWEICTLEKPYKEFREIKEFEKVVIHGNQRLGLEKIPTKSLQMLIEETWHPTPELRPTISKVRRLLEDELDEEVKC